ncbi:MAG TPA: PDZ domain-containing protein [Luteitalea sp.]|nr:PDZ domain-containing protein [Luteitalea sp.]
MTRDTQLTGPAATAITYTLRFPDAARHYIDVEATYPTEGAANLELMMAVWTPGSYLVREFARHVEAVEVVSPAGLPAPAKTRKNRWRIDTGGAGHVTIRYRVYGREMSVRTNWIEAAFALINGAPTFLTVADGTTRPHEVTLELPPDWPHVVSGLPAIDGTPAAFVAADYDTLVDSPIVAGNLRIHDFLHDGKSHLLVDVDEGGSWNGARAAGDVARIVETQSTMWGGLPYDRYVFVNMFTETGGGLEHANSTVLMTSCWAMGSRDAYLGWLGLVSHEFFHVWNAKRLRPVALGPFDYEAENYTPSLWVTEGFTTYYGDLLLARAGLADEREYLSLLSEEIKAVETTPGRFVQPLTQASRDTWIKFYRPDENSPNTSISYYTKGAVVAALLDARIRIATDGERSLDDVMRLAYERYAGEVGFSDAQLRDAVSEVAGEDLSDVLVQALDTTEPLDYTPLLDAYGLSFVPAASLATRGWVGVTVKTDGGRLVVSQVRRDGPGWTAGLNVDDEIIAIDEYRVRVDQWEKRLEQYPPTTTATLLVSRRDRLTRLHVTFGQEPGNAWRLQPRVSATSKQLAARKAWLGAP